MVENHRHKTLINSPGFWTDTNRSANTVESHFTEKQQWEIMFAEEETSNSATFIALWITTSGPSLNWKISLSVRGEFWLWRSDD